MSRQDASEFHVTVDEITENAEGEQIAALVSDSGVMLTVPAALLPEGVGVNDVLSISFRHECDETEHRRQRISDLQRRLFDRS